ncbi:hypothetical protein OEZ85_009237 [Tetradesmus obliquus]|uniref:PI3K/PI4K catalytic domain-containing protein n=1 Tax=Tetradesmus obliquus TaxID=3088 RepID=A0ABY8U953_TETOB|nr:hypothetical protein OEZ85_009237 [Tetradesmus obliquus]
MRPAVGRAVMAFFAGNKKVCDDWLSRGLLTGLARVVPCSVLYPLIVEVRAAQEGGQEPPPELAAVLSQLQARQPRLLADTAAMAGALEALTVTPREAWAGLLGELGLEVDRKLLALQADAARLVQQGLGKERRIELITNRYHTVMAPVRSLLQQHLAAAEATPPGSPDEAAFRQQAAGVSVGAPRSSWPAAVLRSTFTSLQREAPKQLLARQLLSAAATPATWWARLHCFAASAAVGSMLGWLLGLGDRHLDNLLLDTERGELLHIDFSVCFDKGAALGVPELVPFRLTGMMQAALGPGGLAGPFSAAAAATLSTLRNSGELLAQLLALLLADPAVDWSVEREAHAARKDQDTGVSLKLFASRMEELQQPLLAGLAAALPAVGNGLAAVVSYGEAHLYMQQLAAAADTARSKAAAAAAAAAEAADGEEVVSPCKAPLHIMPG